MKHRILIADDDESARSGLADLLSSWGFEVEQAIDGKDALEKAPAFGPSVVIADLVMPALDGVALLKPLAEGQHLPRVDVVAMYGGADGALVRAAVAAGAKGLVIQALGWGNMNVPMFQAVKEAIGKGIPVAITTRVWTGRVLPNYGFEGGGKTLQQAGAIFADNLSPQKARILLMLALQTTAAGPEIQKIFDR